MTKRALVAGEIVRNACGLSFRVVEGGQWQIRVVALYYDHSEHRFKELGAPARAFRSDFRADGE